jgi:hypothetical protein
LFVDYSTEEEELDTDKTELITLKYAKDTSKQPANEPEQNWINTKFINTNELDAIRSRALLECNNKENLIDYDAFNSDYMNKLLGKPTPTATATITKQSTTASKLDEQKQSETMQIDNKT